MIAEMRVPATPLARDAGDGSAAERRLCEFYGVETLDGFGAFARAEIAAAALALSYVKRTQFEARPALSPPTRRARGAALEIDPATRANLELTRTLAGAREGSLLATIDLTVTPAGARLIAERLASPLTDPRRDQRAARPARLPRRGPPLARSSAADARERARFPALAVAPQPRPRRVRAISPRSATASPRLPRSRAYWRRPTAFRRSSCAIYARAWRRLRRARARSSGDARRRPAARQARRRLRARGRSRRRSTRRGRCATKAAASSPRCRRPTPRRRASGSSRSSTTTSSAITSRRPRRRARRC